MITVSQESCYFSGEGRATIVSEHMKGFLGGGLITHSTSEEEI